MFSKRAALAALALVIASCTPKVGEKPPDQEAYQYNGTACLSDAARVAREYVRAEAKEAEIERSWDCAAAAFTSFGRYVRGESRDSYKPQEVAAFFEQNFLADANTRISPGLQTELMRVKVVFVGGRLDTLTRSELVGIVEVLKTFKTITVRMNRYVGIFLQTWKAQTVPTEQDLKFFEEGNAEIQKAARSLAALARKDHEPYKMSSFVDLLDEVARTFNDENWSTLDVLKRFLPVAQKVKKALAGGDENLIRSDEWSRILVLGGRAYVQYLRYHYFIEPSSKYDEPVLNYVALTAQDSLSIFEELVREKPSHAVTRGEVDEILAAFQKAWPSFKSSDDLVTEVLRLKQVFFGGTIDALSLRDFQTAGLKVGRLKQLVQRLMPYESVYTGDWNPSGLPVADAYRRMEEADALLNATARELGSLLESGYDVNSFRKLIHEFDALYPDLVREGGLEGLLGGYLPTVIDLKNVVFMDQGSTVQAPQWGPFLGLLGRVYLVYRFYQTFIQDGGMIPEARTPSIHRLVSQVLGLVADTLNDKADRRLDRREAGVVLKGIGVFWEAFKVSDGLIDEGFRLKPALLGGDPNLLLQADFIQARAKYDGLIQLLGGMDPHMEVLFGAWNPNSVPKDEAERRFGAGESALTSAAGTASAVFVGGYDLAHLTPLLHEIELLYPPADPTHSLEGFARAYVPTLVEIKKVLFNDDSSVVRVAQWKPLAEAAVRAYMTHRFYNVFVLNSMSSEELVTNLERLADRGLAAVADTLAVKPGQSLDRRELATLLTGVGQAFPSFNVPEKLLAEIMKFKPVLAGGGTETLTAAEINHLRSKVPTLIQVWQRLDPYMYVYKGVWKADGQSQADAVAFHDLAWGELDASAKLVAALLEAPYDLQDLTALLREYEAAFPPEEGEGSLSEMLATSMPLLRQVKNVVFSDTDSVIEVSEWAPMLHLAVKGFSAYRFYGVFIDSRSGREPEIIESWDQMVDRGLGLVRDVLPLKKNGLIPRSELLKLAVQAQKSGFLPKTIRTESLNSVIGLLVNRMMNPPERRLKGERPEGLRELSLDYAQKEFKIWNRNRAFLLETFDYDDGKKIAPATLRQIVSQRRQQTSSAELKAGLGELQEVLDTRVPFVLDSQGRLLLSSHSTPKYDLRTLESHNLWRAVVRLVIASYAGSMAQVRSYDGLGNSELQQAFRDVRPLAIDYDLLEEDDTGFMTSRFMEMNIFMPRSNGDQVASFAEMHDEITAIFSGLKLTSMLSPALRRNCMGGSSARRVNGVCLYRSYQSSFRSVMTSLPDFQRFQKDASDADFYAFFNNLLRGVGQVPNAANSVLISNATLLPPLMQYLELLYIRFDGNRNGLIEVEDARRAFPLFKDLIKMVAKKELESGSIKEDDLLAVFVWVLKEGKPPETLPEKLKFLMWKGNPEKWVIAADRSKLASILGFIGEQLARPAAAR